MPVYVCIFIDRVDSNVSIEIYIQQCKKEITIYGIKLYDNEW